MLSIFDGLRDVTVVSITLRLVLAMICGGIVGMEREYKRRSAGFRTHILICLGAAMTTMTSQHLFLNMHYYLDMARMGGSVVAEVLYQSVIVWYRAAGVALLIELFYKLLFKGCFTLVCHIFISYT